MDSDHVVVVLVGLVLVGGAVAIVLSSPALFGGQSEGGGDARLSEFTTTEPYCGDPNRTSGSAQSYDAPGGEYLAINRTIPVASNDTTVNATVSEFGPQRYVLAVTREPNRTATNETITTAPTTTEPAARTNETTTTEANGTSVPVANETATTEANGTSAPVANETTTRVTDEATTTAPNGTATTPTPTDGAGSRACHPERRFNATVFVPRPQDYTVLITYDDELVAGYWQEGDDTGSFDRVPTTPEPVDDGNGTATTQQRVRPARHRARPR